MHIRQQRRVPEKEVVERVGKVVRGMRDASRNRYAD